MKRREEIRDVGRLLGMIHNGLHRQRESNPVFQEMEGVTGKNGWIIGYLCHHQDQPVYQKDLDKAFNVTRSTASKVLTLMEKKGLVKRCSVAEDARLKEIVLTEQALRIGAQMEELRLDMEERLTRNFTEEEKLELVGYLNRLLDNVKDINNAENETKGVKSE